MSKIIAIISQKGGVGKTTTAVNLASSLAVLEKKVLLIDGDPQGNTTQSFKIPLNQITFETLHLFKKNNSKIKPITTSIASLDVLPTTINLAGIDLNQSKLEKFTFTVQEELLAIKKEYEYIIIDCSPYLNYLTLSFIIASNSVLIPLQCEYFSLQGLGKLFSTIKTIRKNYNKTLDIEGILITMHDKRLVMSNLIVSYIQKHFENLVFQTIIERNIKLSEAPSHGKNIINYDASSKGALNYLTLATEIITNNELETMIDKDNLGKKLEEILKEAKQEKDLSTIFEKFPLKKSNKENNDLETLEKFGSNYEALLGLTKKDIIQLFGQNYNDVNNNEWMFRLRDSINVLKKNYLYLYFKNDIIDSFKLTTFKLKN